jgi:GNAT superfamily N-acetyltransferase
MDVRPYLKADRAVCLEVFQSNTPDFLPPHDRQNFEEFLDGPCSPYFLLEHDAEIVACGGYVVMDDTARLLWGMVRRNWHRQGLGRFLLLFRLREITKIGRIKLVTLSTSQHAAPFYQHQGFKPMRDVEDSYGAASGRVEMSMKLTVCS